MKKVKKGKYLHYKGHIADVLGVAKHSETQVELVIYTHIEAETGKMGLWARPKDMFLAEVEVKGEKVPRFRYLKDES